MGHRALVAYRLADDGYRVHYAHWGARAGRRIGPETPLGGPATDLSGALRADPERDDDRGAASDPDERDAASTLGGLDVDPEGGYLTDADDQETVVDPDPLAADADPATVLAALDETVEFLVVVTSAYETATLVVCPISFRVADPSADPGARADWPETHLVLLRPDGDPGAVRERCAVLRSGLWAAVGEGAIAPDDAATALRVALGEFGTVHEADDPAVFEVV